MIRLNLLRCLAMLFAMAAAAMNAARAQEAGTLYISGTFGMDFLGDGSIGQDLAEVYTRDNEHWWSLTLHGVTYSYDHTYEEWVNAWGPGFYEEFITRVHATSFEFEFFGPDADILNTVVSQQLSKGGMDGDSVLVLRNADYFETGYPDDSGPYAYWDLRLSPADANAGVSFVASYWGIFQHLTEDADGYPIVEPQQFANVETWIEDYRPGNSGAIASFGDIVEIGADGPPTVPPPPLPPPTLSIADAYLREGRKGTSTLTLTVTLSRGITEVVTVNFATANGTADSKTDYISTSGTLTFQPDQTSRTLSIAIKGDTKREANETFTVQLSNPAGATIDDGTATATILNDD